MSTDRKSNCDLGPVPQIMSSISKDSEKVPEDIHDNLVKIWEGCMSKDEYVAWSQCLQVKTDTSSLPPSIFEKLDALILRQSETVGWRMSSSFLVRDRFRVWEGFGIRSGAEHAGWTRLSSWPCLNYARTCQRMPSLHQFTTSKRRPRSQTAQAIRSC